jgi:hypothetical protein
MPFRCIVYTLIIIGSIVYYYAQTDKCKDAGGVYAFNVCVNPSAVVEMD